MQPLNGLNPYLKSPAAGLDRQSACMTRPIRYPCVVEVLDHARLLVLPAHRAPQDDLCQIAPEHVLHPVVVSKTHAHSPAELFQRIKEIALAVFMIDVALRQKNA